MEEWAWASGFFEGEGCICIFNRGDRGDRIVKRIILSLNSTDPDVLERFAATVGYGKIGKVKKRPSHRKQQFRWQTGKTTEVIRILTAMKPWLGERRQFKCDEALSILRGERWTS